MSNIRLERFSRRPLKSIKQAVAVHQFAESLEGAPGDPQHDGIIRRYGSGVNALRSVRRLARTKGFTAMLLRREEQGQVVGIATLIKVGKLTVGNHVFVDAIDLDVTSPLLKNDKEARKQVTGQLLNEATAMVKNEHPGPVLYAGNQGVHPARVICIVPSKLGEGISDRFDPVQIPYEHHVNWPDETPTPVTVSGVNPVFGFQVPEHGTIHYAMIRKDV